MKFLLVSKCGEGAGLLEKIQSEGNDVRIYIKEKDYRTVYNNIIQQIGLHSSWIDDNTTIIFDSSGMGDIADDFKLRGYKVFGASKFHDKIENDRQFGLDVMSQCGILSPGVDEFYGKSMWEDANQEVEWHPSDRLVFKPSGDLPSRLTYVSCDSDDLISYMAFVREYYSDKVKSFILQEFIEGTIVSSEFFCDGKKFVGPPNQTVEVKKLMNGDLGPSTGCSGNLVWLTDRDCEVVKRGIALVEDILIKENYIGPIDLNTIFNDGGVYGLEWTPRFGLDAMPTLLQLLNCDVGKLIFSLARAQMKEIPLLDYFAGGIRVTIPPYPLEPDHATEVQRVSPNLGLPIRGVEDEFLSNFYFYEVMSKDGELVHSEGTGVIAVVSDYDDNPRGCFTRPYSLLDDLKVPDKQYRTDLKEVLPDMYEEVKEKKLCLI